MKLDELDFAERIRRESNIDKAWELLAERFRALGFVYAKYGFVVAQRPGETEPNVVMAGRFCEEWEDAQRGRDWASDDFIVNHLLTQEGPLTFETVYNKIDRGELTPGQIENHNIGREIGMTHGVAVPLRAGNSRSVGGISFEADRDFTVSGFQAHLDATLGELRVLAETFHANLHRPALWDESQHPSPRERECLLWLMRGLRVKEIAFRIGSHPKTVEKQLASVRAKLGAKTNAQAAVRALVLGLVDP